MVYQAAQSIRKTACQCEIHCTSSRNKKQTNKKTKPRKQTKAKFQTELEAHVMRGYL